jgi:hypothetical protein
MMLKGHHHRDLKIEMNATLFTDAISNLANRIGAELFHVTHDLHPNDIMYMVMTEFSESRLANKLNAKERDFFVKYHKAFAHLVAARYMKRLTGWGLEPLPANKTMRAVIFKRFAKLMHEAKITTKSIIQHYKNQSDKPEETDDEYVENFIDSEMFQNSVKHIAMEMIKVVPPGFEQPVLEQIAKSYWNDELTDEDLELQTEIEYFDTAFDNGIRTQIALIRAKNASSSREAKESKILSTHSKIPENRNPSQAKIQSRKEISEPKAHVKMLELAVKGQTLLTGPKGGKYYMIGARKVYVGKIKAKNK